MEQMTMPCHDTVFSIFHEEETVMSKDELYAQLEQARQDQKEGNYTSAKTSLQERMQQVKKKYHV